jgi:hypothetical protein
MEGVKSFWSASCQTGPEAGDAVGGVF